MSVQHRQVYEIDRIVIQKRFQEMQNFIQISRSFSVKIHGHLKILVHLINNLIESEDNLELVDTILKMPDFKSEILKTKYVLRQESEVKTQAEDSNMDKFYKVIQEENKKIQEQLQKGEQNNEFLKEIFNKMFETLQTQQKPVEIVNQMTCPHCNQDVNAPNSNCPRHPNLTESLYLPNEDQTKEYLEQIEKLKKEIDSLGDQIKELKDSAAKREPKIEELTTSLQKQKDNFNDELMKKDKKIESLIKEIEFNQVDLNDLKKQLKKLFRTNKELEDVIRDLLAEKEKPKLDFEKENLIRDNKILQNQLELIKQQNQQLTSNNDNLNIEMKRKTVQIEKTKNIEVEKEQLQFEKEKLNSKINDLENENEYYKKKIEELEKSKQQNYGPVEPDYPKYNHSDFLKCIYTQAHFIESSKFFGNRSYQ